MLAYTLFEEALGIPGALPRWFAIVLFVVVLLGCEKTNARPPPDHPSKAAEFWVSGGIEAATREQTQAIEGDPDNGEHYVIIARMYQERGEPWTAVKILEYGLDSGVHDNRLVTELSAARKLAFQHIPHGRWLKVHEQRQTDAVFFRRQLHGGSAFDTRRGRLILFGSDTHGEDWTNSPLLFDTTHLLWSRLYPNDESTTYVVTDAGLPVAGSEQNHPWAMHTFDAVNYDRANDQLLVCSLPEHMRPGRFTDAVAGVWPNVRRHPTWILDLTNNEWKPLAREPVHFFPYATAYDTERNVIIGYRNSGIYELQGDPPSWQKVTGPGLLGYHNSAVYDSANQALVVFGSHENSNDIVAYFPKTKRHHKMPTPGTRPPKDQHVPMAFHPRLGKTVVLPDRRPPGVSWHERDKNRAETWLYDLGADRWTQVETATLPFGCGMNYNLQYDPIHDVLLLVTSEPRRPTSVWVLRL